MIPILLDAWLLGFSHDAPEAEMNARMNALKRVFSDLKARYPLKILPFLSPNEQADLWVKLSNYKGADRSQISQWIIALSLALDQEPQTAPASINGSPCPALPETWLKILAAEGCDDRSHRWRYPMFFTPEIRRPNWPNNNEISYTHGGTLRTRNLVSIERNHEHKYFESDIDPWRLGCTGEPLPSSPVAEKPATCKRLPRPEQLKLNLPLNLLTAEISKLNNPSCGKNTHYYYLPPVSWLPTERGKDSWRNSSFECDGVVLKEKGKTESGYIDRNGHVWVWDKGEKNHWDVKTTNDIRIARVSYTGLKMRS